MPFRLLLVCWEHALPQTCEIVVATVEGHLINGTLCAFPFRNQLQYPAAVPDLAQLKNKSLPAVAKMQQHINIFGYIKSLVLPSF